MLTFKEVVKKSGLNIPTSTAATFRDAHLKFFRYEGSGRRRKYHESCIDTLRTIVRLKDQGNSPEAIDEALESEFGTNVVLVEEDNNSPPIQQMAVLDAMRQIYREENKGLEEKLLHNSEEIEFLRTEIQELKQQNSTYSKAHKERLEKHDEKLLEVIRLTQQRNEETKKPLSLMEILFGRKIKNG